MDDSRRPPDPSNSRYIQNLAKRDWLSHMQTAYLKQRVSLRHARTKSHYVRYFGVTASNVHFVEQETRTLLGPEIVEKAEALLLERLAAAMKDIDHQTVRVNALLESEGVTALPEYVQAPLEVEAKCTSPKITRYLEAIVKADRLLTLLEALRLSGLVTTNDYDRQVGLAVRRLVSIARAARQLAVGLRKRANKAAAAARAAVAAPPDETELGGASSAPVAPSAPDLIMQPEAASVS
jgi:hypothetical protein